MSLIYSQAPSGYTTLGLERGGHVTLLPAAQDERLHQGRKTKLSSGVSSNLIVPEIEMSQRSALFTLPTLPGQQSQQVLAAPARLPASPAAARVDPTAT